MNAADEKFRWHSELGRTIVVGTGNRHKLAELQTVSSRFGISLLSPAQIQERFGLGPLPTFDEDDPSYRGNALKKALAFSEWSGCPCLGDDSGLEVSALSGRPGVHSARYAGPDASDSDRIIKLLGELRESGSTDRSACFRCALVAVDVAGHLKEAEGVLTGIILEHPAGSGGFGYDPIVRIDDFGKTLAEVDFALTCERGFRARAALRLFSQPAFELP